MALSGDQGMSAVMDPFNARAADAANLAANLDPIGREHSKALKDALRTILGRVEEGSMVVVYAKELPVFRRLVGLPPSMALPPRDGALLRVREHKRKRDVERLDRRLHEHGPMTIRQMREFYEWSNIYATQIAQRLAMSGSERGVVRREVVESSTGRPAYLYRALPKSKDV